MIYISLESLFYALQTNEAIFWLDFKQLVQTTVYSYEVDFLSGRCGRSVSQQFKMSFCSGLEDSRIEQSFKPLWVWTDSSMECFSISLPPYRPASSFCLEDFLQNWTVQDPSFKPVKACAILLLNSYSPWNVFQIFNITTTSSFGLDSSEKLQNWTVFKPVKACAQL